MVRTRADNTARKAVAAKAPRKVLGATSSGGASSSVAGLASPAGKYAGGNIACPRPTPDWQKGIGTFFTKTEKVDTDKENTEPDDLGVGELSATKDSGSSTGSSENSSQGSSTESTVKAKKNGLIDSDSDED